MKEIWGPEPTYEELKLTPFPIRRSSNTCPEPTYEELKQDGLIHIVGFARESRAYL